MLKRLLAEAEAFWSLRTDEEIREYMGISHPLFKFDRRKVYKDKFIYIYLCRAAREMEIEERAEIGAYIANVLNKHIPFAISTESTESTENENTDPLEG